tara:strand:+ start:131 stop:565 length:435 start_codon:yes stop_codon:yes gene_type:complete
MSKTKRQIILLAFNELGLASYEYDLTPGEMQITLEKLDDMMTEWEIRSIFLSYNLSSQSNLDDVSNIPSSANQAVYTNLAKRIAPSQGKILSNETKAAASRGLKMLQARAAKPPQMSLGPYVVAGAGNRYRGINRSPFLPTGSN